MLVRPHRHQFSPTQCSKHFSSYHTPTVNSLFLWLLKTFSPVLCNDPWALGARVVLNVCQLELGSTTLYFGCWRNRRHLQQMILRKLQAHMQKNIIKPICIYHLALKTNFKWSKDPNTETLTPEGARRKYSQYLP